jgi:hypothetical protein
MHTLRAGDNATAVGSDINTRHSLLVALQLIAQRELVA